MINFSTTYRTQETPESYYAECQQLVIVAETSKGRYEIPCSLSFISVRPTWKQERQAIFSEWNILANNPTWAQSIASTLAVKPEKVIDSFADWQGFREC